MADEADLLIEAGFSDAKLARESAKVIGMFKDAGTKAEKAFQSAVDSVSGSQKVKATARELDQLKRQFDPLYAASKRYEAQLSKLDRAQAAGAISAKQYGAALNRLNDDFAGGAGKAEQGTRKFGGSLQQVGFQVGDFATQVGAGTSATQALGQQLPQLLGAFGTFGALAGAAAAVMIPLGSALLKTAFDSETLEERMKALSSSTDAMQEAAKAAATPISDLRARYGDLADEVARANSAMAMMTAIRAKAEAIGAGRGLSNALGIQFRPTDLPAQMDGSVSSLRQRIQDRNLEWWAARQLEQAMAGLQRKTGATADQAERLRMALNRTDTSTNLQQVATDSENLLTIISELYSTADEKQRKFLVGWASQVSAVMNSAKQQIEAGAREEQRLFDTYDENTQKLGRLADDREKAEKGLAEAVKSGNEEKIESYGRVLKAIDGEVVTVQRAIAELDGSLDAFVSRLKGRAGEITGSLGAAFEKFTGWSPAQFGKDAEASKRGLRELIKSRESGGDYNVTLDNGAYTGGPRDLVNMTINEVLAMQKQMLADPRNKKNSSAAGAYQIVRKTLLSLVEDLGLNGGEMFTPAMQDRLADELIRRRRGQGVEGLRNEWEGLRKVSPALIQQALGAEPLSRVDPEVEKRQSQALKEQADAQKRRLDLAKQLSEQIAKDLLTAEQAAQIEQKRAEAIAAIRERGGSQEEQAAAIARVNAEMQRQITIMALMEEAKRRGVDLDARMVGSTLTYRDAIEQLGETAAQKVLADQQMAASVSQLAAAQDFANDKMQTLQDGFINAIIAGESFADVLKNVAAQMAKAWAQAALFGSGPLASQGGGGLFAGLFRNGGLLSQVFGGAGRGGSLFSYDGGGFTGSGPRMGGIDGKGGFPAILHPNETVIDHTRGQRLGGGTVNLVVDVRGANGNTEIQQMVAAGVSQGMDQVRREVPGIMQNYQKRTG